MAFDKDSSFYCSIKSTITTAITVGAILWDLSLGIFIGPLQQSHTHMGTHIEQLSDLKPFEVTAHLGSQEDAGTRTEFAVLLVHLASEVQLFKVHEGHGHCRLLISTVL